MSQRSFCYLEWRVDRQEEATTSPQSPICPAKSRNADPGWRDQGESCLLGLIEAWEGIDRARPSREKEPRAARTVCVLCAARENEGQGGGTGTQRGEAKRKTITHTTATLLFPHPALHSQPACALSLSSPFASSHPTCNLHHDLLSLIHRPALVLDVKYRCKCS